MSQNFFIAWMSKACMSFQYIVWNRNGIQLRLLGVIESQTIQLQELRQWITAGMHRKLTAGGLLPLLYLCCDSKVMLTVNLKAA